MDVNTLYQDIILDHSRSPHGKGLREPYEAEVHHVNPTCGDEITLRVHLSGDTVQDISYDAEGCSISQASASVLNDLVVGRSVDDGMALLEEFQTLMQGRGNVEPDEERLADGVAFAGVAKFPTRVKCALLSWMAWKDATAKAVESNGATAKAVESNGATAKAVESNGATAKAVESNGADAPAKEEA